jgi:hypothetical protein
LRNFLSRAKVAWKRKNENAKYINVLWYFMANFDNPSKNLNLFPNQKRKRQPTNPRVKKVPERKPVQ